MLVVVRLLDIGTQRNVLILIRQIVGGMAVYFVMLLILRDKMLKNAFQTVIDIKYNV